MLSQMAGTHGSEFHRFRDVVRRAGARFAAAFRPFDFAARAFAAAGRAVLAGAARLALLFFAVRRAAAGFAALPAGVRFAAADAAGRFLAAGTDAGRFFPAGADAVRFSPDAERAVSGAAVLDDCVTADGASDAPGV